jgi:hypothetical protein
MFSGRFFLTTILITVSIIFIQWFFIGFLFHKYQSSTPATWRKESSGSYIGSMILSLFFAVMFTTIFYIWKTAYGQVNIFSGIKFGVICWITFSVISEIGNAIYINYSKKFVIGKCISSFVEYVVAGILAASIL